MGIPKSAINIRAQLLPTIFGRLGPDCLEELAVHARTEHYEVPTLINTAGTPLQSLRLVVEGNIAIVARRASGKEVTIGDMGPGSWAALLPCFAPKPPEFDYYSGAASSFIALPVAQVQAFCVRHPEIYPWVIAEIGQRMRLLMEWTGQSVLVGPEQRMARLIHILARDQRVAAPGGTLNVTQTRLATLARCSRQSANGLLGALEKKGLIRLAYGKCEIPNIEALAAFAEREAGDAD